MNDFVPSSNVLPLNNEQFANCSDNMEQKTNGLFKIRPVNDWMKEAAQRKDPKALIPYIWYEYENCCCFADSYVGKTLYTVQQCEKIAEKQPLAYFDFELSDKQFQLRYTDKATGKLHEFPPNFYRVEIDIEGLDFDTDFEDQVIKNIEQVVLTMNVKILVIDNLTWLCNESEKGDAAGRLMKSLMQLKKKHDLSILVLAHTPKRNLSNPITQNDLAGSKKLFNFFDSAFAIGLSAKDEGLRYIKQLKCRGGQLVYNSNNVLVCCIEQVGDFLQFTEIGNATEKEHLKDMDKKEAIALLEGVIALHNEGKTQREIAEELGTSPSTVNRLLKNHYEK